MYTCSIDVVPVKRAGFGRDDSRPILLDNVACVGNEVNISQCDYDTVNNCDHSEDTGVICGCTHVHINTKCFTAYYSIQIQCIGELSHDNKHVFNVLCSVMCGRECSSSRWRYF